MVQSLKKQAARFHRREDGAVLLMMLAMSLILLLVSWTLFDSGQAARQKVKLQAASDSAAMSQASVKARSMNMLAYTNVAKRSTFAIHAVYLSHFMAYLDWGAAIKAIGEVVCVFVNPDKDDYDPDDDDLCNTVKSLGDNWILLWKAEGINDFENFAGFDLRAELQNEAGIGWDNDSFLTGNLTDLVSSVDGGALLAALFGGNWSRLIEELVGAAGRAFRVVEFDDVVNMDWGQRPSFTTDYYAQDIKALDNYQRYLAGMAPWWAWSEQLVKGVRNGATLTASFPRPRGGMPFGNLASSVAGTLGVSGQSGTTLGDGLPVRPGDGPDIFGGTSGGGQPTVTMASEIDRQLEEGRQIFGNLSDAAGTILKDQDTSALSFSHPSGAFFIEYLVNLIVASIPVEIPAIGRTVYAKPDDEDSALADFAKYGFAAMVAGHTHFRLSGSDPESGQQNSDYGMSGLDASQIIFNRYVREHAASPWVLREYQNRGQWLQASSNIVFGYLRQDELFGDERNKFNVPSRDYGYESFVGETIYRTSGYWTLARSEVSFQGEGAPSLWVPAWTARLRPLALDGEFDQAGYRLHEAYRDVLASVELIAETDVTQFWPQGAVRDFAQMERALRAVGDDTVGGINK